MMVIEMVFIGLCAITTSDPLECRFDSGQNDTEPFNVVFVDPGGFAGHDPTLWIRRDCVDQAVAECYHENEYRKEEPTATSDCDPTPKNVWVRWDLRDKELIILQKKDAKGKLKRGDRKRGARCWAGKSPGNNKACTSQKAKCEKDVSWLPQYRRAVGGGRIDPAVFDHPGDTPFVSAIIRGVAGELAATGDSAQWGNPWSWESNYPNYPDCPADLPEYEQRFARMGVIGGIETNASSIYLVDLHTSEEEEIPLNEPANEPVKMEVRNLPAPGKGQPIQRGNRCYIPHFDAFALLLEDPPICRRVPYYEIAPGAACSGAVGMTDPICPPGVFGKP